MDSDIKPIQATPEICGEDAMRILQEVMTPPSEEAIAYHERMLELFKDVLKK